MWTDFDDFWTQIHYFEVKKFKSVVRLLLNCFKKNFKILIFTPLPLITKMQELEDFTPPKILQARVEKERVVKYTHKLDTDINFTVFTTYPPC